MAGVLAFLRRLFWSCSHDEMVRERLDNGAYEVRCNRCGYHVPLIRRYREEGF